MKYKLEFIKVSNKINRVVSRLSEIYKTMRWEDPFFVGEARSQQAHEHYDPIEEYLTEELGKLKYRSEKLKRIVQYRKHKYSLAERLIIWIRDNLFNLIFSASLIGAAVLLLILIGQQGGF